MTELDTRSVNDILQNGCRNLFWQQTKLGNLDNEIDVTDSIFLAIFVSVLVLKTTEKLKSQNVSLNKK